MPRPEQKDYDKLKWLLLRLVASEDYCRPYFERAKRHYKLYRFGSAVDEKDWPYVNRVRSRDILAFIEDSTALQVQTLFATTPFYAVIPRETRVLMIQHQGLDPMAIGEQISRFLDYEISHEDTEFFAEIVDFLKGDKIFGNSYIGIYPKFQEDGTYLRPLIKTTDFWDILPIVGAKRVSKAKGLFIRDFCTLEDLQKATVGGKPVYKNLDKIKTAGSTQTDPDKDWHKVLLQEIGMTEWIPEENTIEILDYVSGGHIITIADRFAIIRDSTESEDENVPVEKPYPYDIPIVQNKYMPIPLEFFAMGIPEVLEVLQEDKNLIRSARRDNIDLVIQKVLKARSGADINFDLIKYYPAAIWPLENLTDIEPLEQKDVTQSSYQEEAMREHDMENALSLFGYARGMTPQHSEQPTTVLKLQQASLNRLDLSIKLVEFGPLQQIATRIILLARRFMNPKIYEAIIGDQDAGFYQLNEEDIRRFFYFRPVGSSVTHIKEVRQAQIEKTFQFLGGINPQMMAMNVQPFTVDWYEAAMEALEALDIRSRDRILIKLQQQQQPMMGGMGGVPQGEEMNQLAQIMYGGQQ